MIFDLTDFTDSITVKMFLREDQEADADEAIKQGKFIKLKGITTIDRFDGATGSITDQKCEGFLLPGGDNAPVKRVSSVIRRAVYKGYHKTGKAVGNAGLGCD